MSEPGSPPRSSPGVHARPYSIDPGPGRLLLLRVFRIDSVELAAQFFREVRIATRSLGDRVVVCVDYRPTRLFSPAVAEEMGRGIADTNDRIERSAVLSSRNHATQSLQSSRLVKTARLAERRQFVDEAELTVWLNEVLSPAEQTRLRRFLAEYHAE